MPSLWTGGKLVDKVDFIVCSDLHIRSTTPKARTDNYREAMSYKLNTLKEYARKYDAFVLCAGDVFDRPVVSPELETYAWEHLPKSIFAIPGQHDLPQHNIKYLHKSSLGVLSTAGGLLVFNDNNPGAGLQKCYVEGFYWNRGFKNKKPHAKKTNVALVHKLTVQKADKSQKKLLELSDSIAAEDLMKELSEYKIIISGDNHKRFVVEKKGQLLINPGSMMRMSADQYDHQPGFYLVNTDLEYKFVPFKIDKEAITREHIETEQKRNERIEAFVSRIDSDYEIGLSFQKNVQSFTQKNKVRKGVQEILNEVLHEC